MRYLVIATCLCIFNSSCTMPTSEDSERSPASKSTHQILWSGRAELLDKQDGYNSLVIDVVERASALVDEVPGYHDVRFGTLRQIRDSLDDDAYEYSPTPKDRLVYHRLSTDPNYRDGEIYIDQIRGDRGSLLFSVSDHELRYHLLTSTGADVTSISRSDYDTGVEYEAFKGTLPLPDSAEKVEGELVIAKNAEEVLGTVHFQPAPRTDTSTVGGQTKNQFRGRVVYGDDTLHIHVDVLNTTNTSSGDSFSNSGSSIRALGETWTVGGDEYALRNARMTTMSSSDGFNSYASIEGEGDVLRNREKVGAIGSEPVPNDAESSRLFLTVDGAKIQMSTAK